MMTLFTHFKLDIQQGNLIQRTVAFRKEWMLTDMPPQSNLKIWKKEGNSSGSLFKV
jgi:hypothetical protein